MTISPKPTQQPAAKALPCCHLYLDDIEEITGIVKDAGASTLQPNLAGPVIRYEVEDKVCDTIDDLKTIGGVHRSFRLTDGYDRELVISPSGIEFSPKGSAYSHVQQVCMNRRSRLASLLTSEAAILA